MEAPRGDHTQGGREDLPRSLEKRDRGSWQVDRGSLEAPGRDPGLGMRWLCSDSHRAAKPRRDSHPKARDSKVQPTALTPCQYQGAPGLGRARPTLQEGTAPELGGTVGRGPRLLQAWEAAGCCRDPAAGSQGLCMTIPLSTWHVLNADPSILCPPPVSTGGH